jgi:hypothetical protein
MNGGTEYLFQKTIDAQPSCAGKKQPSKHERIERLIEFYEIVEAADVLQFHGQDRDDHIDDHRDRDEAHPEAEERQRTAQELGVRADMAALNESSPSSALRPSELASAPSEFWVEAPKPNSKIVGSKWALWRP